MSIVILALLILAAVSMGLRMTVPLAARLHPAARLAAAVTVGGIMSTAFLMYCDSQRVFEFGLGLLLSVSPVGVFDLVKWWFLWDRPAP